ncbi:hypothetical protein C0J52_07788 [Blattella germanica]|nr:hypothetical protein C0J52_07788 [Blattella germanica]
MNVNFIWMVMPICKMLNTGKAKSKHEVNDPHALRVNGVYFVEMDRRAQNYKNEQFYISDSNILMCKLCNKWLCWEKRDVLEKHIKSNQHVHVKEDFASKTTEEQRGVKFKLQFQSLKRKQRMCMKKKKSFYQRHGENVLKANIPLNKLDEPAMREYLKKYVPGSGDLPTASRLRTEYMPRCGEAIHNDIKMVLEGKPIVVIADGTSGREERCVFAVLFRTMVPVEIRCKFVSEVSEQISKLITELEGSNYPFAHKKWDELNSLNMALGSYATGWLPSNTYKLLNLVKSTCHLAQQILISNASVHVATTLLKLKPYKSHTNLKTIYDNRFKKYRQKNSTKI